MDGRGRAESHLSKLYKRKSIIKEEEGKEERKNVRFLKTFCSRGWSLLLRGSWFRLFSIFCFICGGQTAVERRSISLTIEDGGVEVCYWSLDLITGFLSD